MQRSHHEVAREVQLVQVQPRLFRKNISEQHRRRRRREKDFKDAYFRSAFDVRKPGWDSNWGLRRGS